MSNKPVTGKQALTDATDNSKKLGSALTGLTGALWRATRAAEGKFMQKTAPVASRAFWASLVIYTANHMDGDRSALSILGNMPGQAWNFISTEGVEAGTDMLDMLKGKAQELEASLMQKLGGGDAEMEANTNTSAFNIHSAGDFDKLLAEAEMVAAEDPEFHAAIIAELHADAERLRAVHTFDPRGDAPSMEMAA